MTGDQFAHTIAVIESADNPNVRLGDGGRAFGRYQIHPDAMTTYEKEFQMWPLLGELWDVFVYRLITKFFSYYSSAGYNAPEIAMHWHLGHSIRQGDPGWDTNYANRFLHAAGWLASGSRLSATYVTLYHRARLALTA